MKFMRALALTFILGLAIPAAAQDEQKPDLASAEAFVRDLYSHYKADKPIINIGAGTDKVSIKGFVPCQ